MGFSFSAAAVVIGVSLLIIFQIFAGNLLPAITNINDSYKGLRDRLKTQDEAAINITSVSDVGWWNAGWQYRKLIIINHTQVAADLINFPILLDITDNSLSLLAQSDGGDIAFIGEGNIQYNHEIEYYYGVTGHLIAWINMTRIYKDRDTWMFMYFGHSGVTEQQHMVDTWNGNYVMVLHMNQTSGQLRDSTRNHHNGTKVGATAVSSAKIDGGYQWTGGKAEYVVVSDLANGAYYESGDYTISIWFKADTVSSPSTVLVSDWYNTVSFEYGWFLGIDSNGYLVYHIGNGATGSQAITGTTQVNTNTWCHVEVVDRGLTATTGKNTTIYLNGKVEKDAARLGKASNSNRIFTIGAKYTYGGYTNQFVGFLDETRVSQTARNISWVSTGYNTMNTPTTFIHEQSLLETNVYHYVSITMQNTGNANLQVKKCTLLVNGTKTAFIPLQPYLYPKKTTSILAEVWYFDSFYSSADDGWISKSDASSYSTAHNSATGTIGLGTSIVIGQYTSGGMPANYNIKRGFVFFNTTGLTKDATVISGNLSIYGYIDGSTTDFSITIQNGQPTYPHLPLVFGDYYYTQYSGDGGRLSTTIFYLSRNQILLNTTGNGWINKTGITKLCLRSNKDINSISPTTDEEVSIYSNEQGSTYAPKLYLTYSRTTATTKTIKIITENGKVDYGVFTL